ncbi:hypothetical protein B0T24DRAFT_722781 [Lasiosphaeria ovina]|uniref:Uncharacterized protein n=1 Tax=Lasiosphaeria ovina TaxID=92902 RepID=A0AAE0JZK0_9PEZI|nr:hypothetical protein B0T24DRAFT_722781 [Lasiosphaeria ovina]
MTLRARNSVSEAAAAAALAVRCRSGSAIQAGHILGIQGSLSRLSPFEGPCRICNTPLRVDLGPCPQLVGG